MANLCSYCIGALPDKHFELRSAKDDPKTPPIKLCNWRCLGLYAITKGWGAMPAAQPEKENMTP